MSLLQKLQKNKIFKFISSVRLAVPLLITLGIVAALGTIIESRYNTELAKLLLYDSTWFLVLLSFLWINIFCATLSRYPFKKHQVGFVITHIGLLTLLGGSFVTKIYGIDGQVRIVEGETENQVNLPELILQKKFNSSFNIAAFYFFLKQKKYYS